MPVFCSSEPHRPRQPNMLLTPEFKMWLQQRSGRYLRPQMTLNAVPPLSTQTHASILSSSTICCAG
jgi:hypothetical protein